MAPGIPIIKILALGLLHGHGRVFRFAPESKAISSRRKGDTPLAEGIPADKRRRFESAVRQRWSKLTDDDIASTAGNPGQLGAVIAQRYGKPREEAEREVREWIESITTG